MFTMLQYSRCSLAPPMTCKCKPWATKIVKPCWELGLDNFFNHINAYLSELFVLSFCPIIFARCRWSLRSASCGDYLIPRSYTAAKQNRAFSAAGHSIWNGLPVELRSLPRDFSSSFHSLLIKTFLFARAWERFWVVTLKGRYINSIDR